MNKEPLPGPWTTSETCLLYCTISLIGATVVPLSVENIICYTVQPRMVKKKSGYFNRTKTLPQVSWKLRYLEQKPKRASVLINSCWHTLLIILYSNIHCFNPNKVSIHVTILYHHANFQTNGKESSEENPSIIQTDRPPLLVNIP